MWAETPRTPVPRLPAVCEKNVFHFFRSSASGKPHFSHSAGSHARPNQTNVQCKEHRIEEKSTHNILSTRTKNYFKGKSEPVMIKIILSSLTGLVTKHEKTSGWHKQQRIKGNVNVEVHLRTHYLCKLF